MGFYTLWRIFNGFLGIQQYFVLCLFLDVWLWITVLALGEASSVYRDSSRSSSSIIKSRFSSDGPSRISTFRKSASGMIVAWPLPILQRATKPSPANRQLRLTSLPADDVRTSSLPTDVRAGPARSGPLSLTPQ